MASLANLWLPCVVGLVACAAVSLVIGRPWRNRRRHDLADAPANGRLADAPANGRSGDGRPGDGRSGDGRSEGGTT